MLKPIKDQIVVKPAEVEKTTAGGLFIPTSATVGPVHGTVVAVGSGKVADSGTLVPLDVSVGDTVLYPKGAGVEVKHNDTAYTVLAESQLIAILTQE
jgi:chaperonin GroES